jgi:hypothetical protein
VLVHGHGMLMMGSVADKVRCRECRCGVLCLSTLQQVWENQEEHPSIDGGSTVVCDL